MNQLQLILCVLGISSCESDDFTDLTDKCNEPGGKEISFIGKVYNNDPFRNTYYVGAIDDHHGGRIPCNGIPHSFRKEGLVVKVEGITKGSPPDTSDPVYGYILITNIELHKE